MHSYIGAIVRKSVASLCAGSEFGLRNCVELAVPPTLRDVDQSIRAVYNGHSLLANEFLPRGTNATKATFLLVRTHIQRGDTTLAHSTPPLRHEA